MCMAARPRPSSSVLQEIWAMHLRLPVPQGTCTLMDRCDCCAGLPAGQQRHLQCQLLRHQGDDQLPAHSREGRQRCVSSAEQAQALWLSGMAPQAAALAAQCELQVSLSQSIEKIIACRTSISTLAPRHGPSGCCVGHLCCRSKRLWQAHSQNRTGCCLIAWRCAGCGGVPGQVHVAH